MSRWITCPLGDLLTESRIDVEFSDPQRRITVKLNVKGVQRREPSAEKEGATRYYVRKAGQFIYGKQNLHKGAFGIVPTELDGFQSSSDLPAFDVSTSIVPEWIHYWLLKGDTWRAFDKLARGVGSRRTNVEDFLGFEISYPADKAEQKRIVHGVEETEVKHGTLTTELDHQRTLLKQLRQAILQEAVRGSLTAAWRTKHHELISGSNDANALLWRMRAEKDALVKGGKLRKAKPIPPIEPEEVPFELPEGWLWVRAEELCKPGQTITYGVLKPVWVDDGVPTVRVKDLINGEIVLDDIVQCSPARAMKFSKTTLEEGDLLIAKDGATLGKTGFVPPELVGGNITQHVVRFPINVDLWRWYVRLVIDSPYGQTSLTRDTRGVALPGVNVGDFRKLLVPLPPRAEQQAISELVHDKFNSVRSFETENSASMDRVRSLLQSVLSEVMGGGAKYGEVEETPKQVRGDLSMAADAVVPYGKKGK